MIHKMVTYLSFELFEIFIFLCFILIFREGQKQINRWRTNTLGLWLTSTNHSEETLGGWASWIRSKELWIYWCSMHGWYKSLHLFNTISWVVIKDFNMSKLYRKKKTYQKKIYWSICFVCVSFCLSNLLWFIYLQWPDKNINCYDAM